MRKYQRAGSLLLALTALTLAPAIAHAAVRMPTHVACVGDSITAGAGSSNAATKSYPALLQGLFGADVQVKNFGNSGSTMLSPTYGDKPYVNQTEYTGAGTFVSGAGESALVDVIIMLGTNDSKPQNWTPANKPKNDQQYLKDYRAMVEHFTNLTPKPVVFLALPLATGNAPCCAINGKVIHDEILPLIKQLAAEKNLPTIDLNTPTTGHPEYFGDGVHPNDAAYVIVAKLMHEGLLVDLKPGGGGGNGSGGGGGSAVGGNGGGGLAGSAGNAGADAGAAGASGSVASGGTGGIGGAAAGSAGAATAGSPGSAGAAGVVALPDPPPDTDGGCAVAPGKAASSAGTGFSLLLLALLGKRRRAARRMC